MLLRQSFSQCLLVILLVSFFVLPLQGQGLSALGKYGPDGIPFTPDDPLEAKANVWGTKMSLSAHHLYEDRDPKESDPKVPSTDQGTPFEATVVDLMSADFNYGAGELDLKAYNLHPDTPEMGQENPNVGSLLGWKKVTDADANPTSLLHDLSPVSTVVNGGDNIEFSAPALGSVCWRNGSIVAQNETDTDFASHLKISWEPRSGGSGDPRVMDEPSMAKSVRFVRMKNCHIMAQGACIFNLDSGGVALNTMFHFGFAGAAVMLNPNIKELIGGVLEDDDIKDKIKTGIEDACGGGVVGAIAAAIITPIIAKSAPELVDWIVEHWESGLVIPIPIVDDITVSIKGIVPDEYHPMIRILIKVKEYTWFEELVADDDLHKTLTKFAESDPLLQLAVDTAAAEGNLDSIVRGVFNKKFDETTWLEWKDATHPFQRANIDLSQVEKYFDPNRDASALVQLRDCYPDGFTWNRGSLFRSANMYLTGKRRDKKDNGPSGENEWVELIEDVGSQMVTVRMVSVDPYRTRELMAGSLAGWTGFPRPAPDSTGWECFDLATLKKNGFNEMQLSDSSKMLPMPWPFPNYGGGQGIILSCAASGGHYSKDQPSTESNVQDRSNDEFLPREMLFYIGCYNPYGHPDGGGSFEYWGIELSQINGSLSNVSDLSNTVGTIQGYKRLWVSPMRELVLPSGPIRFVDGMVVNGQLDSVSPTRHPEPTRQYQFFWDYDTDGTVDNHEIANTSRYFDGTSTTTLFTVDWDCTIKAGATTRSYTGTGKTGMYQMPVFVN